MGAAFDLLRVLHTRVVKATLVAEATVLAEFARERVPLLALAIHAVVPVRAIVMVGIWALAIGAVLTKSAGLLARLLGLGLCRTGRFAATGSGCLVLKLGIVKALLHLRVGKLVARCDKLFCQLRDITWGLDVIPGIECQDAILDKVAEDILFGFRGWDLCWLFWGMD